MKQPVTCGGGSGPSPVADVALYAVPGELEDVSLPEERI